MLENSCVTFPNSYQLLIKMREFTIKITSLFPLLVAEGAMFHVIFHVCSMYADSVRILFTAQSFCYRLSLTPSLSSLFLFSSVKGILSYKVKDLLYGQQDVCECACKQFLPPTLVSSPHTHTTPSMLFPCCFMMTPMGFYSVPFQIFICEDWEDGRYSFCSET